MPLLPRVTASMIAFCQANADGVRWPAQQCSGCAKPVADLFCLQISEGLEVLPGVEALLAALADRPNCVTGLVTGNLEPIGWAKMAALGLKRHFTQPLLGGCVWTRGSSAALVLAVALS